MKVTGRDDAPPVEMSPAAWALTQPWWLHPHCSEAAPTPPAPEARRDFAVMATQIGLAAWMLGMALTSACVPGDGVGGVEAAAARLEWLSRPLAGTRPAPTTPIPDAPISATHVVAAAGPVTH